MNTYGDVALGVECALPRIPAPAPAGRRTRWLAWITGALLLSCAVQFGPDLFTRTRQAVAHMLLNYAWQQILAGNRQGAPWPWSEARPVARLTVPSLGVKRLVLAGSARPAGIPTPIHKVGTPTPGRQGNSVISDPDGQALDFLRHLKRGDLIAIERSDQRAVDYRVTDIEVLDRRDVWVMKNEGPTRLTLIGCPPSGGPCVDRSPRYVVIARALTPIQHAAR